MPGRKSTILKQLQGTARIDRTNPDEPNGVAGLPDPVFELSELERYCYEVLSEDLAVLGILSVTDRAAIYDAAVNLAELHSFREQLKEIGTDSREVLAASMANLEERNGE